MANKNLFNSIQLQRPKLNHFDLTHDVKLTLDMGQLIPVMVLDTVPGDRFTIAHETLIRFAPLIAPVMHRMDVTIHTFFVPHRLVWEDWEQFITGASLAGPDAGPVPERPWLQLNTGTYTGSKLWDYLGFPNPDAVPPPAPSAVIDVDAKVFASYQCIFDNYYRDQNVQFAVDYKLVPGSNGANPDLQVLRNRAWEHDYFTSALPFAQKGSAVDLPLGNITLDPDWHLSTFNNPTFVEPSGDYSQGDVENSNTGFISVGGNLSAFDPKGSLINEPTTINDFRRAMALQKWLELNARGGTRYVESILTHFGVKSSDARLQRPEYITGTKTPVVISEVLNTTGTAELPQGNMSGHGISVSGGKRGSYFCEEHGYIISIMSVLPRTAYQQGVPRMYMRGSSLDYYWPSFANIGEQAVQNFELYVQHLFPENTFGYVPRYSEYKYMPSRVAGDFKTSLDFWHLGRIFAAEPSLNPGFIVSNPTKRVFAVVDDDVNSLYAHVLNRVSALRPMPKFGTPSSI